MDDEEALTPEEAAWIVANRHLIVGEPTGAVIGPLAGEEAVKFLEELSAQRNDATVETGVERWGVK